MKRIYYISLLLILISLQSHGQTSRISRKISMIAPVAYSASNISDIGFTANWSSVEGATLYLLDVYSYNETKSEKTYLLQNEEINDTKCKIENLSAKVSYYYVVRATDGTNVSPYSNEIGVERNSDEIKAPKLLPATNITENGFTANWETVAKASIYWIYVLETFTAPEDGTYTVINEDFNKITFGTTTKPYQGGLTELLDDYTNYGGWEASLPLFAKGMIGIGDDMGISILLSPRIDLADGNDGKFTVLFDYVCDSGSKLTVVKGCTDAPHTETTEVLELNLEGTKGSASLEFSHANPLALGGIDLNFSCQAGKKVFFDNFKIQKELKKGETFSYIAWGQISNTKNQVISVPIELTPQANYSYSYSVVVLKPLEVDPFMEFLGYENKMHVDMPLSVEENIQDQAKNSIYLAGSDLHVDLEKESTIDVYSISGQLLKHIQGEPGNNIIAIQTSGVYVVKAGNTVTKIIK